MTRLAMTAALIADFKKREATSRFFKEDFASYKKHLASRSLEQVSRCFNNMNYMQSSTAKKYFEAETTKMVNAPGYMSKRAA